MKISRTTLIRGLAALIILGGGVAAMELLASTKAEAGKHEVEQPVRRVEAMTPRFGDNVYTVRGSGLIESAGSIVLYSTVSGKVTYSLANLLDGTAVEEGQLLLKIDSRQAENNLNLARSELIKAVASLIPQFRTSGNGQYEKWSDYLNSLDFSGKSVPDLPEAADSREKLLAGTYGIYNAFYSVRNAEILLEQYSLYSPMDGYISCKGIVPDSFISAGQPLLTIVDGVNLKISVPLAVEELKRLGSGNGSPAEIFSPRSGGASLAGTLASRDAAVNPGSQSMDVQILFSNVDLDPDFAPGNYVDLQIEGKILRNTASIPRHTLQENSFVYTCEEGRLAKADVIVEAVAGDRVYIGNTLPPGTLIVTTILQKPLPGMKLEVMDNEKDS